MEDGLLIEVTEKDDLAKTRQMTRSFLQDMKAPLQEQARISWLTNYLARQILTLNSNGEMILNVVEEDGQKGVQITCEGWWLHGVGFSYELHIVPVMEKSDVAQFKGGTDPKLTIIAWVTETD